MKPATVRFIGVYSIEIATICVAAWLAFLLRFDFDIPAYYRGTLIFSLMVWVPVKLASFKALGLDRRWARYISMADLLRLSLSNLIGTLVSLAILLAVHSGVPRTVYAIDLLISIMLTVGSRVGVRLASESMRARSQPGNRKRTIIYGAGDAGAALLRELRQNTALPYDVCGFVDDSPRKQGLVLNGVRVLGDGDALPHAARKQGADLVLIAIPAATGPQMKQILEKCTAAGIPYKTIPGLAEMIQGNGLARQIRDVAVEDLLGRIPVRLEQDRISARLQGQIVLVTGAAGSIGSEICRQIARFKPAAIVGFEIAESPVFNLQLEFARMFPEVSFHAEIGSIQKPARLAEVFERYRPSVVYHAAAYKHVPLMESHIFEAIENNVFGTMNVVEAARKHGIGEFVMISSDKAVRPTNVMGATKRIAELLVRSLQPAEGRYVSVRFGNVLGSNGSVVPIFKEQIARGGPVTVTHPEMRRYFMTIPEACQLVLQASTMGKGGEIFVLDMGEPVRIVDLARNLILLSGLRPEHDIKIEFSGIRPGEKLFEELNVEDEGLLATHHRKIRVFAGEMKPWEQIGSQLAGLRRCCNGSDVEESVTILREMVPDYVPSADLSRQGARNAVNSPARAFEAV
ncbi:MAG: nucleoside-diphosphate sugar epimerase/dehydratase [Bryobacteraceae bacterium]